MSELSKEDIKKAFVEAIRETILNNIDDIISINRNNGSTTNNNNNVIDDAKNFSVFFESNNNVLDKLYKIRSQQVQYEMQNTSNIEDRINLEIAFNEEQQRLLELKIQEIEKEKKKKSNKKNKAIYDDIIDAEKKTLELLNKKNEALKNQIEEEKKNAERRKKEEEENKKISNKIKQKVDKKFRDSSSTYGRIYREVKKNGGSTKSALAAVAVAGVGGALQSGANFMGKKEVSISEAAKPIADMASMIPGWGKAIGMVIQGVAMAVEEYDKLNVASQKYVRNVGGGEYAMKKMKVQASAVAESLSSWGDLAYNMQSILENMSKLSEQTGRNFEYMSRTEIKSLEDLKKFGISEDVINQFDNFGLNINEIDKKLYKVYGSAGKHGLNAKAVTDALTKNLKLAQSYTFSGGVKSLERMAERAVALKFNLEQATRFADKVSTLEGATQAAAQLNVLGGSFAMNGNPLQLLYGGLNDPEQLMDMMMNMTSNMAKLDNGELKISAYDRQNLKTAAQGFGIDANEMITMALNQGRENIVRKALTENKNKLDTETETYIKNIARINEEGKAVVTFNVGQDNEETKEVSGLTNSDLARLKNESNAKDAREGGTIGDLLVSTRTITDTLNDILGTLKSKIVGLMTELINGTDKKKAEMQGLNQSNAEFYSDLFHDYQNAGLSTQGINRLKQIGIEVDDSLEQKLQDKDLSYNEFQKMIIDQLHVIQAAGYSKDVNDINSENNKYWFNKNGEKVSKIELSSGGYVSGPGSSTSDSIPARLSNGEFVVNASATSRHRDTLEAINAQGFANGGIVKPIDNQLNALKVSNIIVSTSGSNNSSLSFEPLKIDISGRIDLATPNGSKSIDSKDILSKDIIDKIIKEIQIRMDYGLDKSKMHIKYN